MTTLENITSDTHLSFFDIEKLLMPHQDPRDNFLQFQNFIISLKVNQPIDEKEKIEAFLNDMRISEDTNATLTWVNEQTLKVARDKIAKSQDKSDSCFHNFVLKKKPLIVENFDIFNQLDQDMPNFSEVTEFYRGAFALNQSRNRYSAPNVVLLLGNPGIGKTHYAKKLGHLLNTPYRFFDSNGITASWVLSGNNATWKSAEAGLIFKEMAKSETISPLILLDEIDKLNQGTYSPFSTFHQMFEKENAKTFYDEYVDLEFDASQIIYILTANDIHSIPESLLSRMNVFTIDNPSTDSMKKIIQSIYHDVISESSLFNETLKDSEVDKMIHMTPREVTQLISKNVYTQASYLIQSEIKSKQDLIINGKPASKTPLGFV